jgi:hypothetical protein
LATGRIGTTPVLTVRWSKAPAAGTTSLSGLDDNSVSLVYSVGYEQVYRNGTLLSRGNDYTATNGTSITLIDATLAGDIIEVIANATIALTDTYTQSQANGKFINNTLTTTTGDIIYASAANTPARLGIGSTDQVLKVSGGIPAWGATAFNTGYAYTSSSQTTTSTSYTDLSTVTSVTVTTGTKALVTIKAMMGNNGVSNVWEHCSFAVSGATTISASDERSISAYHQAANNNIVEAGAAFVVTGLTAGSNTFTLKFSAAGGGASTTAFFERRSISVVDLGS